MGKQMTDSEIIKGLQHCKNAETAGCAGCCYYNNTVTCVTTLMNDSLDLINRQKAEIEALIAGQETLQNHIASVKSEAIKEFAETLKFMAKKDGAYDYVSWHQIDSVEKELTGKEDEGK